MVVAMCDETKGWSSFNVCVCYINCCICLYSFSSAYLRVFGDDRVRGTREQMMLQVVLVERRAGAWASWEPLWQYFIIFTSFKDFLVII